MERLCQDCKHCVDGRVIIRDGQRVEIHDSGSSQCDALSGLQSPVTGVDLPQGVKMQALWMRAGACGWRDPKWWEPRGQ